MAKKSRSAQRSKGIQGAAMRRLHNNKQKAPTRSFQPVGQPVPLTPDMVPPQQPQIDPALLDAIRRFQPVGTPVPLQ